MKSRLIAHLSAILALVIVLSAASATAASAASASASATAASAAAPPAAASATAASASASATPPETAAETEQLCVCRTSEELTCYMLRQLGDRETFISVTIPDTMPEADLECAELLTQILEQDSGFIRWGYKGGMARIIKNSGYTTYEFRIRYNSTKEQDDSARDIAAGIVETWNVKNLTDLEKIQLLKEYIQANWRYDATLKNVTAHSTLTSGKGTCLGFVMAGQLLLESMDIASQTVHGKFSGMNEYHILLLVKLGDWWYTFDPSELAREAPIYNSYLKQSYRELFTPEAEYLTDSFRSAHPMNRQLASLG